MSLREAIRGITENLKYLGRDGSMQSGDRSIRYHSENGVRDAVKKQLLAHGIEMITRNIYTEVVFSDTIQPGNRVYTQTQARADVEIELRKGEELEEFHASASATGDDKSNASTAATTLAIRNWMRAEFQITYDPSEEEEVEEAPPSLEMSPAMTENAKLMIVKAEISKVKAAAKKAGYKPSSWNLNKMTEEDLFHCSAIAMDLVVKSSQSKVLDQVSKDLGSE